MNGQLQALDSALFHALNGSDSLLMDGVMWTLTRTATWIPLMACLLYIVLKNNDLRRACLLLATAVLLLVLTDQFSSAVCKPYFHRLRPSRDPLLEPAALLVGGYAGGLYGFISSHAANTFGAALFFTLLFRHARSGLVLFAWACLTSYSRVYLGVHYPGDILAGATCGLLLGGVAHLLVSRVARAIAPRRSFYSSAYTPSGYLIGDMNALWAVFSLTLVYVMVRAVVTASAL